MIIKHVLELHFTRVFSFPPDSTITTIMGPSHLDFCPHQATDYANHWVLHNTTYTV